MFVVALTGIDGGWGAPFDLRAYRVKHQKLTNAGLDNIGFVFRARLCNQRISTQSSLPGSFTHPFARLKLFFSHPSCHPESQNFCFFFKKKIYIYIKKETEGASVILQFDVAVSSSSLFKFPGCMNCICDHRVTTINTRR